MEIEGEIRIFRNFLPNFLRERDEVRSRIKARNYTEITGMLRKHLDTVVRRAVELGTRHVEPVKNRVSMVLRVKPEAVPEGETVRVWIPFPQRNELQPFVKLVSTYPRSIFLPRRIPPEDNIFRGKIS